MLAGLGRLFVQGIAVDWSAIYRSGHVVDLPGHPWQHRRYWPDGEGAARVSVAAGGHPLLGQPFKTADRSWIWSSRLSVETLPWLRDHAVRGATLLPATAYLEMATAAARQIFGHAGVVVKTLQLKEPVVLSPSHDRVVQVSATSGRPGHWSINFHVHDDVADAWTLVGSTNIRADDTLVTSSLGPKRIESSAILSARFLARRMPRAKAARLRISSNFLNILWLDVEGNTVRAVARVNDELKTAAYALHPALSDAALQALVAGILQRSPDQALLIPRSIGQARLLPTAASIRTVHICAELSLTDGSGLTGDVRLYGADGALLAELCAVEFQAFRAAQTLRRLRRSIVWIGSRRKKMRGVWLACQANGSWCPTKWALVKPSRQRSDCRAKRLKSSSEEQTPFGFRGDTPEPRLTANKAVRAGIKVVHFRSLDLPDDASADSISKMLPRLRRWLL